MMVETPTRQISAPMASQRSGRNPSKAIPQMSEPATNTPPYAARILPKMRLGLHGGDKSIGAQSEDAETGP
jgi:hypothetical protein